MEEFKLNINAYSPEYGRSNGGTVMVIGKSGGNQLHGTFFEFLRNEDLNARNYFAPAGAKPEFRRNQYGFTVGGPIRRNKTFFFADWQGTRLRTGITRQSVVPTIAQRSGVFTATIYDPATTPRVALPNNTIPATRFDPLALQILQHYPLPNASGANNFIFMGVESDNQDQFDARVDHKVNDKHRAFVRYSYLRDNDTPVPFFPDGSGNLTSGAIGHGITRGDGVASEYDWTILPATLNQARFGFTRRDVNQSSLQNGGITIPGAPVSTFPSTLPIFTVTGYQQVGPTTAANAKFTTSVTEFLDTLSIVRGRHTFKSRNGHTARSTRCRESRESHRFIRLHHHRFKLFHRHRRQCAGFFAAGSSERVQYRYSKPGPAAARAHRRVVCWRRLENFESAYRQHRGALHAKFPIHRSE